jgi:hypothetical protein
MRYRTTSAGNANIGLRLLLGAMLLGTLALFDGCSSTPTLRTTTTERTIVQQNVAVSPLGTTVTTRTHQYTP